MRLRPALGGARVALPEAEAPGRRQGNRAGDSRRGRCSGSVRGRDRLRCWAPQPSTNARGAIPLPRSPVRPAVQACELFYAWEKTHNPSLLNRAADDAHSWRVPWHFKPRFISVFNGLHRWARKGANSPMAISFEHAVQVVCDQQVRANLTSRDRPAFQTTIARFSQPSTANKRSAKQRH
jgi:hypothetical protein